MSLAGRTGEEDVVLGHPRPVGLVQVLADMQGIRVIRGMELHGQRPVVCSPGHLEPSTLGPFGESSSSGEQVDGNHFAAPWSATSLAMRRLQPAQLSLLSLLPSS